LEQFDLDGLGFLFKVLTPSTPLSLQVHPTSAQAEAGFAAEDAAGISVDDPRRLFRDRSAKPEVVVALGGEFDALAGNASDEEVHRTLDILEQAGYPSQWASLWREKIAGSRAEAVSWLLSGEDGAWEAVASLAAVSGSSELLNLLWTHYPGDPGCAVALMLNRVVLLPGEALYVAAGQPHAYLSGVAVELMAPSDNVLRGGLTPKHVDVDQLLGVASFDPSPVPILDPLIRGLGWVEYRPEGEAFTLHRMSLGLSDPRVDFSLPTPAVIVSVAQGGVVSVGGVVTEFAPGEAAVVHDASGSEEVSVLPGSSLWIAHRR
jgi:mannose-6-phosphate isomerase